ncbi:MULTISPECIES: FMN-dependent NADH-azoreductase [unclassified Rathayibacter]|uniref:FMN-dependent NADH-azoreductase n=1 Tax=unclassified Rathayibacter TaxID=2609250 RepID=UPI00070119C9|nr:MULTISPECIES: NAD(P)H-dependent oxidoreductase [unclassified Rathayibacter]KQQ03406.1 ACP phosphodiesterase [Rathayibacter sp. Leaf294]KQS11861.1 ACP phosphodiesterase [Rathayibacter sp. Leaf185]
MSLFRLDGSIRTEGSTSRALGDLVEAEWSAAHPDSAITRRHIGVEPIAATTWSDAVTASTTPELERTPGQTAAVALAAELTDELAAADALLFAVPLYNFGVSQHFKSYVDLVVTDPRMAPGAAPVTAGKPAVLVTVQGGNYAAGTPREGWDHATAWMRRILEDVWQLDLEIVTREFTLVGVNPALDQFTEIADELKRLAESRATQHGRALAGLRRAA